MTKRFWMLLVCLLLVCSAALAECAVCGGDSVCDTCQGNGYLLMQAYGSDEQLKVACTGGCDNGQCPDCAVPCDVCGSDGKCDVCGGLGYLLMQAYGSGEEVKVACTGENCADGACAACSTAEPEAETDYDLPYTFEDAVVESAVRMKLDKEKGDTVTIGEIAQITQLDLSYSPGGGRKKITSLKDVSRMTHLEELDLFLNDVSDLSDLSGLVHLRVLDLAYNIFTDLSPLASLSALEDLNLHGCEGITDFSLLSTFENLHTLCLQKTGFSDITLLHPLKKLKDLDICNTSVADLSPLSSMTQLEELDIADLVTEEWEHLSSLVHLKKLVLGYEERSDLSPLAVLKQLNHLVITGNDLDDLSPLSELVNLTYLELYKTNVVDVSALASLKNLTELNLCYNEIEDVTPLAGLTKLTELNLYGNNVSDASPLDALPALEKLILTENPAAPKTTQSSFWGNKSLFATPAPTKKVSPIAGFADKVRKADTQSGSTLTIEVFIGDDHRKYTITTDETYVLDALLEANLIEGEDVSWGFNVTIVDGVKASYNRKGEYWSILEYVNGGYTSMMDSLANRKVRDGDRYAFRLMN